MIRVVTPTRTDGEATCVEEDCDEYVAARDRCAACYKRALKLRTVDPDPGVRVVTGEGYLNHGYWIVPVPEHLQHLFPGRRSQGEHRMVMAASLNRPLEPDEQVHHINGDRLDNRLENLELWSTSHPSGQRVEDKVSWALTMVARYRPDALKRPSGPEDQVERGAGTIASHDGDPMK